MEVDAVLLEALHVVGSLDIELVGLALEVRRLHRGTVLENVSERVADRLEDLSKRVVRSNGDDLVGSGGLGKFILERRGSFIGSSRVFHADIQISIRLAFLSWSRIEDARLV